MQISGQDLTLKSELPGRVSVFMVSEVRPQVSGIIQKRLFEEGADVRAGQANAEMAAARAALDTARINLDYTKVTSPIYEKTIQTAFRETWCRGKISAPR